MGPFVAGRQGKQYILSIIDCFFCYLILVPLRDHTAMTVSYALYERVIGYFGCPKKILSDRGTVFTGRLWKELLELLGIQQLLTSQGNGIVERSYRTVGNMIRAHLANRDDKVWVDVLPGIMLAYNEMEQGQHGYSASQVMWRQGMNLPADLSHGTVSEKDQDQHQFVKNMGRELREIREKVRPFNNNKDKVATNPFKEGDLILIHQQPMERTHKLPPKWCGPFKVNKIPNLFQVQYEDKGREKIIHVRNCKKFRGPASDGNKQPFIAKGCRIDAKCQCQVRRQRRMTCHIINVLAEGSKWTSQNPAHFCK